MSCLEANIAWLPFNIYIFDFVNLSESSNDKETILKVNKKVTCITVCQIQNKQITLYILRLNFTLFFDKFPKNNYLEIFCWVALWQGSNHLGMKNVNRVICQSWRQPFPTTAPDQKCSLRVCQVLPQKIKFCIISLQAKLFHKMNNSYCH